MTRTARLLLISDEPHVRPLRAQLERLFGASAAVDFRPADGSIIGPEYDVVLIDTSNDGEDAGAAAEKFREKNPLMPLIVIGREDFGEPVAALRKGADDFVPHTQLDRLPPIVNRATTQSRAQNRSGEALRRSESRYRELMEHASDGIYIVGPDLRFLDVNRRGCEIAGRTREEILGLQAEQVLLGLDEAPLQLEALREGRTVLRERDGSVRAIEIHSKLLSDGTIQAIVRDITERKESEARIRESEERFRLVFDATNDAIFDWNIRDSSLWMNDRMRELVGAYPDDAVDHVGWWLDHVHADDRETVLGRALAALSGADDDSPMEYRFERGDGVTLYVRQRMFRIVDAAGATVRVIATLTDLTGTRTAEQALVRSEDRFRALIEGSHDVVVLFSSEGVPLYATDSLYTIIGYRPDEFVGRADTFEDIHPDDRERVNELFAHIVAGGTVHRAEYRYRHRDGSWRWLEAMGRNMLDNPAVGAIVVNFRDLTERRAWQRRLEQAERLSSLGRLAATIAHEFNNVLMGIQPFAEVLRRRVGDDQSALTACSHIENSVRRGRSITQEILRFTQAAEPEIASVDTEGWMNDLAAELRGLLPPQMHLRIEQNRAVMAADRSQITQALTNLVFNARDVMGESGTITITIDSQGSGSVITTSDVLDPRAYVHITVRDEGPGIPPGLQQRIFEPLFTTKKGGTGLGLAIVHQIVTRHGGFIFVESTQGSGSAFHMLIPRARSSQEEARSATAAEKTDGRGARVLLIEDEIAVAEGIATILEMEGYLVHTVHSGTDGAAALETFQPDLIILDIGLPDVDGFDLYESLADRLQDVPVIFSTGHGDATRLETIPSADRTRFLQKPYSSDALLTTMQEILKTEE